MAGAAGVGGEFFAVLDALLVDECLDLGIEAGRGGAANGQPEFVMTDPAFGIGGFGKGAEDRLIEWGFGRKVWQVFAEEAEGTVNVGADEFAQFNGVLHGFGSYR